MEKRVRSPNYPALSLPDALDKVKELYSNLHNHAGPREVIAKGMGYASLNGSSMTAISALHKYGLIEGRGDEIKISDRAMRIMHPETPEEHDAALKEAAADPPLFAELDERFPDFVPNEDLLHNYLVRRNFAPAAVTQVIRSYRETKELVGAESGGYDSPVTSTKGETGMHPQSSAPQPQGPSVAPPFMPMNQGGSRLVVSYAFEGGGAVSIVVNGDITTEEALDMAEVQIGLKRKEIERRKRATAVTVVPSEEDSDLDKIIE